MILIHMHGKYELIAPKTPTQIAHPWKATLRTMGAFLLTVISALVVAVPIFNETMAGFLPDSWQTWLVGAVALLTTLLTLFTRLMQVPALQPFLIKIGFGTGVETETPSIPVVIETGPSATEED